MPPFFSGMVVIVPFQWEGAEDAIDHEGLASLGKFSGFGLINRIDLISSRLEQKPNQRIGGFENGCAHQHFQLLDGHPVGLARLKARHQLSDLLILGEEEFGGGLFFFNPEASSARVLWMTNSAYCWVSC